ncbi:cytochrome c oxidase subunit 4 [Rothia sp. HC945]|uniref:cytochrome c oxidase subunit 4 n=1 Tax=Rothia sp. HC945 TaxID=3171170 RepID=UPI003F20F810
MRENAILFWILFIFFIPVTIVYGFMTGFTEWVGFPALLLTALMSAFLGFFFSFTAKKHPNQPSDNLDGEIVDAAGDYGFYSPWSWWPLLLAIAAAIGVVAMAIGWWMLMLAAPVALIGLVGWVYEYSRGNHAH